MKQYLNILLVLIIGLALFNCSSDDDGYGNITNPPADAPEIDVRINEILLANAGDKIELKNFGDAEVDVTAFKLCSRFVYPTLGDMTVETGSLTIPAKGILVVSGFDLDAASADLGLYRPIDGDLEFSEPAFMLDFVQWGESGIGRESVAVEKGIWTAGDFVPAIADNHSMEYDGDGNASSDWVDQADSSLGSENKAAGN